MGFPLIWPDSSIFGTICVLDTQTNKHAISYSNLLAEFTNVVNSDLKFLTEMNERKAAQRDLRKARDELELRVRLRTRELANANKGLKKEISVRRETEKSLLKREVKLEAANIALKVLLERVEGSRSKLEEQILANINELVMPYLERLKRRIKDEKSLAYISIIEDNINEITSPFGSYLTSKFSKLSPTELEVAKLIMQGKTTKGIADVLNTATSTIDFHRTNIRKKIGINRDPVSLRTYLSSDL
jgi:DNA-binding CsgD family transcriptional regulator